MGNIYLLSFFSCLCFSWGQINPRRDKHKSHTHPRPSGSVHNRSAANRIFIRLWSRSADTETREAAWESWARPALTPRRRFSLPDPRLKHVPGRSASRFEGQKVRRLCGLLRFDVVVPLAAWYLRHINGAEQWVKHRKGASIFFGAVSVIK